MALQRDPELAPSEIARAVFPTAFRGYDQDAVRRYLTRLASALERREPHGNVGGVGDRGPGTGAGDRVEELEAEIALLQGEIRELETELVQRSVDYAEHGDPADRPELDEHRAIELLGQETARVLESARSAAADILQRAESKATNLKAEAKEELVEARRQAKRMVAEKWSEAEEAADRMTREAEEAARRTREEADEHRAAVVQESARILADAEAGAETTEVDAQERARQIVADAEALRHQVVAELVTDRRTARAELDRLGEARDRLALSLAVARSELDDLTDALAQTSTAGAGSDRADGAPVEVDGDEVARLIDRLEAEGVGDLASTPAAKPASKTSESAAKPASKSGGDTADDVAPAGGTSSQDEGSAAGGSGEGSGSAGPAGGSGEGSGSAGPADDGAEDGGEADEIDLREADVDTVVASDDILNPPPPDGAPLSLVEGFSTIVLTDEETGQDPDGSEPARGPGGRSSRRSGSAGGRAVATDEPGVVPVGTIAGDRVDPALVITTVAARSGGIAVNRTQGDLPLDDPGDGVLPDHFAARDLALARSGANFRRQIRRALNDDQSEVLDRLRSGRGAIRTDELMTRGEQIDHYLVPLRRGLTDVVRAGVTVGGGGDAGEAVAAALDNLVDQLAVYLVERVRTPTVAAIEEADHDDRERILDPIRALYRDLRNAGLPDLVDDALHEAFAIGLYEGIGEGAASRWEIDPRTDPDPVCEVNRDRTGVVKGEPFPSGHVRPLAVPGCRCLVTAAN